VILIFPKNLAWLYLEFFSCLHFEFVDHLGNAQPKTLCFAKSYPGESTFLPVKFCLPLSIAVVCLSVCWARLCAAKMAELIEVLFWI